MKNLENQYNQYQNQMNNYSPSSREFAQIKNTLDEINKKANEIKQAQSEYTNEANDAYKKSMALFLKSLDSNNTFGKSMFYLAQLFVETPYRFNEINYNDLPKIFKLIPPEYRHAVSDYKGSVDLMPFESSNIRDDLSSIYDPENLKLY